VRKFLLGLLDANDNTSNPYNDSQYLASLLAAIGNAYSSMSVNDEADKEDMNRAVDVISRTMTMDRLVPSYQNVVTQAGIKVRIVTWAQLIPGPFEAHHCRQDQ
jgi:transcription initiation factor TFIID subunit 2